MTERQTYLLVDGENIDATLGTSILQRRPHPEERPRWNRVREFIEDEWEQPVTALFFLAIDGEVPLAFVQALLAMGYQPVMLRGAGKVVDLGIQRTAEALIERDGDVVLASHDVDFLPQMTALAEDEDRRVALMGFNEFIAGGLREIPGVEVWDMEHDVQAFDAPLPRMRVIDIEDFDPFEFL
ncbi:NYN domain-containing protein [Micrococcus lylae]|uniref:NYN domain-containing protein n=1 Tax=Micrococcus lylae TaxID=1273 RepID=A0ABY2K1G6_9MICC|nr:NYN domain-containing protein [Micrococcus lylae]TFH99937.1 NYN domain-containing protein [Micrococcus lylae]